MILDGKNAIESALGADPVNGKTFTAGESELPQSQSTSTAELVRAVVESRSSSVAGIVESTVAYSKGLMSFRADAEKLTEFLQALHEAKVLTEDEVKAGLSPKSDSAASKMKKISEYADIIRDQRILSLLSPGYSVLYELVLLFQELERRQQGVAHLRTRLMTSNGPVSRSWLKSQRAKLEAETAANSSKATQADLPVVDASDAPSIVSQSDGDTEIRVAQPTISAAEVDSAPIVAVLLTVTSKDVVRLEKALRDKADPCCLSLRDKIDNRSVLLVHANAATLTSMQAVVKSLGFDRCSRVGLVGELKGNDITSKNVMAIYVRGGLKGISETVDWHAENDPIALANRIIAGIEGRRMHLLAKSQSEGWGALIGEANWQS